MINEKNKKDLLISVANKAKEIKVTSENIETTENTEEQELFIDR